MIEGKKNYIILKSFPNSERRAWAEEKARLSGVLKTEEQSRGLAGILYTLKWLNAAEHANKP